MKECAERVVTVGFSREPKVIFDEVELITSKMIRLGWSLENSIVDDSLEKIHLFFERNIKIIK